MALPTRAGFEIITQANGLEVYFPISNIGDLLQHYTESSIDVIEGQPTVITTDLTDIFTVSIYKDGKVVTDALDVEITSTEVTINASPTITGLTVKVSGKRV